MRRLHRLIALLILLPGVIAGADDRAIDLDRARALFAEAEACSRTDAGELWGVELHGPMLFVDRVSRQVVANRADAAGHLTARDGLFVGTLPDDRNTANTAFEWAGVEWTMLLWPLPERRYRRDLLMTHELFHRIQDDIGLPMSNPDCGHLDTRDGRTWMRMELRALAEALLRRDDERRGAITDALTFRAHRRALFPDRVDDERALELNEGLAEYTGFRLCGLPANVLADRAAIQLDDYEARPTFVRNFAYATGPAYGILLDEAGGQWRPGLTLDSDLGDLLADAASAHVPTDPGGLARAAIARVDRYDAHRVIDQETRRHEEREARLAAVRQRFVDGPLLLVPAARTIRYSFNPNGVEAFDGIGTVYDPTRVTDAWGTLEVTAGGALMVREGTAVARFVVPAPDDPDARPLVGDGWTLELADGWTLRPGERSGDFVLARDRRVPKPRPQVSRVGARRSEPGS